MLIAPVTIRTSRHHIERAIAALTFQMKDLDRRIEKYRNVGLLRIEREGVEMSLLTLQDALAAHDAKVEG